MKENEVIKTMRVYAGVLTDPSPVQLTADEVDNLHHDVADILLLAANALEAWLEMKVA
jgi:hypothetical protein